MKDLIDKFEGKYFLYNVYDKLSHNNMLFSEGNGFELYEFVNEKMNGKVTIENSGEGFVPLEEDVLRYLSNHNIEELYNPQLFGDMHYDLVYNSEEIIRGGYCEGLEYPFNIDNKGIRMIGFD